MLTVTAIRNAAPGGKPYKLADRHGLYLLVKPNGAKLWRYDYRHGGKRKTFALGEFPMMDLATARAEHERLWKLVKAGTDPMEEKRLAKLVPAGVDSFAAVFLEWWGKMAPTWSESHAKAVRDRFERDLLPDLGRMPLKDITAPILLSVLQKIEQRGALYLAKRAREMTGTLFRYGIVTGRCERDPAADLRGAFVGHVEQHRPAIVDPAAAAELLRVIWDYPGSFVTRQAFRLIVLTALRPGEIQELEWAEVDFDAAEIRIPKEKMKMKTPHLVPLSRQALAILGETHELTGRGRYVLPGARNPRGDRPISNAALSAALLRLGFRDQQTPHGFRGLFCSLANEHGHFNPDAIERQLAHQERNGIRAAYLHSQFLPERRRLMQWWADYVETLREGRRRRGKVVNFPGGGG